jgi:hypothetical protein
LSVDCEERCCCAVRRLSVACRPPAGRLSYVSVVRCAKFSDLKTGGCFSDLIQNSWFCNVLHSALTARVTWLYHPANLQTTLGFRLCWLFSPWGRWPTDGSGQLWSWPCLTKNVTYILYKYIPTYYVHTYVVSSTTCLLVLVCTSDFIIIA